MEYSLEQTNIYDPFQPLANTIPSVNRLQKDMAAYASLLSSNTPQDTYKQVISDMENTGRSQYVDSVVGLIKTDEDRQRQSTMAALLGDPEVSKDEKLSALKYYEQNREVIPNLRDRYVTQVATRYDNTPLNPEAFATGFFEKEKALSNLQQELNTTAMNWSNNTTSKVGGLLLEVFPFIGTGLKGLQFTEALNAIKGEDPGTIKKYWNVLVNGVLQGSAAKEIRDYIDQLPSLEQKTEAVKKILKTVEDLPGTDFNRWTFTMQALDGDMANWEKYLYNGLGIIGAAYGARAIVGGIGTLTKSGATLTIDPKSVLGETAAHNPTVAGEMAGKALEDTTGAIADAVGVERSNIVGSMLPKVDNEVSSALGVEYNQTLHNVLNSLDETGKESLRTTEQAGSLYTDEAKSLLNRKVQEAISTVDGAALHLGKSEVQFVDEIGGITDYGIKGKAVLGKTSDSAFGTYNEALSASKQLSGDLPEGVVSIMKIGEDGKLVPAPAPGGFWRNKPGEYYIQYAYDRKINPQDVMLFGDDAVKIRFDLFGRENKLLSNVFTSLAKGPLGSYLFAHQMMPLKATRAAFSSYDKALAVEDQFLGAARNYIANQPSKQRKLVAEILEEGEKFQDGGIIGKVFTYDEVVQKGLAKGLVKGEAEEVANGYFIYRRISDWMYTFLDREKSASFARDGFLWHTTKSDRFIGKVITNLDDLKDVKQVLNKSTGALEALSREELETLYKSDGYIVRLGHHVRNGDEIIEYAKVVKGAKMEEITQGALPYIKGWVPRFYDNNYFVTRTPKAVVVNGVKITDPERVKQYRSTHYASDNRKGALIKQDELGLKDETGTYHIRPERLDVKTMLTIAEVSRSSMINTAHRGLEAVPGATLVDPLEGLMKVVQSASRVAAMSDFLEASRHSFVKQYGSFLREKGVFPSTKEGLYLRPNASEFEIEQFKNANTIFNWLEGMSLMQRYDSAMWKNVMYGAAEFSEKFSQHLASSFRFLGKHYPVDSLKKLATTLFISMRPARQILLQPSQLLLLGSIDTSLLNPLNASKFASQIMALNVGHLHNNVGYRLGGIDKKTVDKLLAYTGAKSFGVSEEEYVKMLNQLKSTGLMQSVDMNTLIDGLFTQHGKKLVSTKVEDVANTVGGLTKGITFNYGRAIGFDRGEQWNLIGSWLVARKRFQKMFPDKDVFSSFATDTIAADAREIAYSMTRPGMFQYQKNALSLPLQFIAAPHKSFLSMTTNKMWTPQEKARLMASSFVLYGSAGVGMLWVMDDLRQRFGTDLSPEQWKLLEGGVIDWGVNYLINSMFDEKDKKSDLDLARSFSPSSVLPFQEFLMAMSDKPVADIILGPSWSVIDPEKGRLVRGIRDIAMLHKRDPITNDNFTDSMWRAIEIASGGTDWMKYRLARNLHWTVTTNGALVDKKATTAEAIGQLFGIGPTRARVYFETNKFLQDEDKEVAKAAKYFHDSILRISRTGKDDPEATENLIRNMNAFRNFENDERLDRALTKHFNDAERKVFSTTEESVHMNIYKNAQYRSDEANERLYKFLQSVGQEDAANQIKGLIGKE